MKETVGEFRVECEAGATGCFRGATNSLYVAVGQRMLRNGSEDMWDSVTINCKKEESGALAIRITLFHPDWEEAKQVLRIESHPQSKGPALTISLDGDWKTC
jgi:hypothetical protein